MNMLDCLFTVEDGVVQCYAGESKLRVPEKLGVELMKRQAISRPLILGIRPEHIRLSTGEGMTLTLHHAENTGSDIYLYLAFKEIKSKVIVRAASGTSSGNNSTAGSQVNIYPDWEEARFFDQKDGESIF
jgi:oligogalacturonide transport system ATP-binding protein